jgi:hypothetical protein
MGNVYRDNLVGFVLNRGTYAILVTFLRPPPPNRALLPQRVLWGDVRQLQPVSQGRVSLANDHEAASMPLAATGSSAR